MKVLIKFRGSLKINNNKLDTDCVYQVVKRKQVITINKIKRNEFNNRCIWSKRTVRPTY